MESKINNYEKTVGDFFYNWWLKLSQKTHFKDTYSIHNGFFVDNIKTYKEAIENMNNLVGKLLGLQKNKTMEVLDAGCGVGGTVLDLAKKYPNVSFTGITLTTEHIKLAKKITREKKLENTKFELASFINTSYPDNNFDCVYAIESICYAKNIADFINEMYRILKPGGRLLVIDFFCTEVKLNSFLKLIYKETCKKYNVEKIPLINELNIKMKKKGFVDIDIKDISRNIVPPITEFAFSYYLFAILHDLHWILKKIIRYKKSEDSLVSYFDNPIIIPAFFLGSIGFIKYYTITSVKK
jgi:ubiquinone/menaquinone biosynthesis C-methylase UbiE